MTETFTASNGMTVERDHNLDVLIGRGTETVGLFMADGTALALREFFRHEEDERLGRWRFPENPDYVVYPWTVDPASRNARGVTVLVERIPRPYTVWEDNIDVLYGDSADESSRRLGRDAARAYFTAHPEPKPAWHTASDGEIWMLERTDQPGERAYLALEGRFFPVPPVKPSGAHWEPAPFASGFRSGTRFYPEGDA